MTSSHLIANLLNLFYSTGVLNQTTNFKFLISVVVCDLNLQQQLKGRLLF